MGKLKKAVKNPFFWSLALFTLGILIWLSARFIPNFANLYFDCIYRPLGGAFGSIMGALPFSLMESGICILVFALIYWTVRLVLKIKEGKKAVLKYFVKVIKIPVFVLSAVFLLFVMFCGVNYYRVSFSEQIGLKTEKSSVKELYSLCGELVSEAKEYGAQIERNLDGTLKYQEGDYKMALKAKKEFQSFASQYDFMGMGFESFGRPKPIFFSKVMSYLQISGVYTPYTFEANVCTAGPDFLKGATMMHEQCHLRGFMNEAEANFIAYLAGAESGDIYFKYSSTCLALLHSMNALYSADYDAWLEIREKYPEFLSADMMAQNAYIAKYETAIGEISDRVNDTYLKINDQKDGVQSYGKMVDLLLAYKKSVQ